MPHQNNNNFKVSEKLIKLKKQIIRQDVHFQNCFGLQMLQYRFEPL